ncbi:class I SAM-dependent methyltransferase [Evansella cellulosilytica]|uniref:Methyltransferase type 11 n=1 Tax=Evansella cellulosilytica (strain ATCC 21833 / DSM 2522 / FERM P-1141 / JCM 9156 / N-4) TaxID=649639 RepID=E6TYI0_EVAC2|nr:methyltransferase domain-containing protein [Evansella cellulosilytica]ADU28918.1 Methyltransferase type 11 [Evansella cellulosilytica DSM 2522]
MRRKGSIETLMYDGSYYEVVGDFLKEKYLDYGFTKGTTKEVDFLIEELNLQKQSRVLDVGCGPGRHTLELARRGYRAFGIDISSEFIKLAEEKAAGEKLPADFMKMDARNLTFKNEFDAAICLCEGAFGLAGNEHNHRQVLKSVYHALRPGSLFVLTAINALGLVKRITNETQFDPYSCTVVDKEIITNSNGDTKQVSLYTTAFTYRELKLFLEGEGFLVKAAYGCTAGEFSTEPIQVDSMEIMMIAERK